MIGVDHVREKLRAVLLAPEKLRSPYAGISVHDHDGAVVVQAIDRQGPAADLGIAPGDVVRAVGGRPVPCATAYALSWLEQTAPEVELALERAGSARTVKVRPLPAAAWAVFRQTGLAVREVSIVDDAEAVRAAAIAGYRRFTGDPNAFPSELPESLLRVERVHPAAESAGVRPNDFVLAVQVTDETGGAAELRRFQRTAELQRCCNEHATYEGSALTAWIVRGSEVLVLELPAKRLPW